MKFLISKTGILYLSFILSIIIFIITWGKSLIYSIFGLIMIIYSFSKIFFLRKLRYLSLGIEKIIHYVGSIISHILIILLYLLMIIPLIQIVKSKINRRLKPNSSEILVECLSTFDFERMY